MKATPRRNSCANTLAKLVQSRPEIYCVLLATNNTASRRTDLSSNFTAVTLESVWLRARNLVQR
jgi:hypothetical protein